MAIHVQKGTSSPTQAFPNLFTQKAIKLDEKIKRNMHKWFLEFVAHKMKKTLPFQGVTSKGPP